MARHGTLASELGLLCINRESLAVYWRHCLTEWGICTPPHQLLPQEMENLCCQMISRVVLQRYQNIGNNCAVLSIHFRIAKFPTKLAPGWTFGW